MSRPTWGTCNLLSGTVQSVVSAFGKFNAVVLLDGGQTVTVTTEVPYGVTPPDWKAGDKVNVEFHAPAAVLRKA